MRRRPAAWAWLALALGLAAMLPALIERVGVDVSNDTFEITMPEPDLIGLTHAGLMPEEVYGTLRDAGLTSVTVEMETVADYEEDGRVLVFDRAELLAMRFFGAGEEPATLADGTYLALLDPATDILDRIRTAQPASTIEDVEVAGKTLHLVSGIPDLETLPIGWDDDRVSDLLGRGFGVIPRVPAELLSPEFLRAELARLGDEHGLDRLLLTGNQTPFFGSPAEDEAFAAWLAERGIALIPIEFTEQQGLAAYVAATGRAIRLHALNLALVPDPGTAIGQGIRAIKERNLRILFVRPQVTLGAPQQLEQLADVIGGIRDGAPPGTRPGVAAPFAGLEPTPLAWAGAILASAAVAALAGLLLGPGWAVLATAGALLLAVAAAMTGSGLLADLLRLAVAIGFATVAVFVVRPAAGLRRATLEYAKAVGVVIGGGLVLTGLAHRTEFLVSSADFWGVKALLLAPPAIVATWAAYESLGRPRWGDALSVFNLPVRAWHLAALGLVGGLGYLLVLRSDNTGAASDLELLFRQELENVLYVRPRIKEFAFGFPALLVAIVLLTRSRHAWWLMVAAAVGTASAIDTFTHFHAPLHVSILRTLLAAGIGLGLGAAVIGLLGLGLRGARRIGILPRR